jgi:hypothetical protein
VIDPRLACFLACAISVRILLAVTRLSVICSSAQIKVRYIEVHTLNRAASIALGTSGCSAEYSFSEIDDLSELFRLGVCGPIDTDNLVGVPRLMLSEGTGEGSVTCCTSTGVKGLRESDRFRG